MITVRASGSASAELAWDRYFYPARWAEWAGQITRVEFAHPTLRAGESGRVFGPLGVVVDFTVIDLDPAAMTWSWRVGRGPVRVHMGHLVEATASGSRTEWTIAAPAALVWPYLPVARRALRSLVRGPGHAS